MSTIPKKFGFIRTTLTLWAANLFPGRAGVVTDAPMGASTSESWGWWDGSDWRYAARRGGNEAFGSLALGSTLTLNGAARPAWGGIFSGATQESDLVSTVVQQSSETRHVASRMNGVYWDGSVFRCIRTSSNSWPSILSLGYDALWYATDVADPVAGATAALSTKWSVTKAGAQALAAGIGVFGATPPTVRPTVNAACTDLATCITLTNQLRTHLIACGLVQ